MNLRKLYAFAALLLAAMLFVLPAVAQDDDENLVERADRATSFNTLLQAAEAAGLAETLANDGPFTIFAPTDGAFQIALAELGLTAEELLADTETLTNILTFHVVEGAVDSTQLAQLITESDDGVAEIETLSGETLTAQLTADGLILLNGQGIAVNVPDIAASNGIIHAIPGVLLPPSMMGDMDMEMEATEEMMATEEMDMEATEEMMATEEAMMTEEAMEMGTIVDVAAGNDDFSTLVAAVDAADLVDTLSGEGPFTVFAPTNAAFEEALDALGLTAEELLADTETLTSILTYHVVAGELAAEDIVAAVEGAEDGVLEVETVNGEMLTVELIDGMLSLNGQGISVAMADVMASNGIVHAIDGVLLPPSMMEMMGMGDMDMEMEATEEMMATEEMDMEATEEMMATEEAMMTEEAMEMEATEEMMATEEMDMEATEEMMATEEAMMESNTIVDVAAGDENFSTLVAAVEAADLVETLSSEGPFTVFAPTNGAFEAALASLDMTAEELLADTELLTSVLTYHVVAGELTSADIAAAIAESEDNVLEVETVNGATLTAEITTEGVVLLNGEGISVFLADIAASNGIIHAIDGVLLPPMDGMDMEATEEADMEATEEMGDMDAMTPSVMVADQVSLDGTVTVAEVVSNGPGFVVIHADADGAPGPVIGNTAVEDGSNTDVVVELDVTGATPTLYAMLHTDDNEVGTYEFGEVEGADAPVSVDGSVVTPAFAVELVSAADQEVTDNVVNIASVVTQQNGWLVIHADADGAPGPVIGQAQVTEGVNTDVAVEVEGDITDTIFPMLHVDTGEEGVYEFGEVEGADAPVVIDGTVATFPISSTGAAMMEEDMEATEEMEMEATEEMDMEEESEDSDG